MSNLILLKNIQNSIFTIRGQQVMIDRDLAEMYGVENKRLNEQAKRNIERFPNQFRFQLSDDEKTKLVANCDRFEKIKYSSVNPYAFTEQGISMLSAVLRSNTAIQVSVKIMNAFVEMRKFIAYNAGIFQRLDKIEQKQIVTDQKFEKIFKAIEDKDIKPKQGIFYDGQIFDAYIFVADLIKSATKSIVLIDNYVDETVLTLLTKRKKNCTACIYTQSISKKLQLDLKKHNQQYSPIDIKNFRNAHDRFLILDDKTIYHFGASLKDLGKKWFAFSRFDKGAVDILGRVGK